MTATAPAPAPIYMRTLHNGHGEIRHYNHRGTLTHGVACTCRHGARLDPWTAHVVDVCTRCGGWGWVRT